MKQQQGMVLVIGMVVLLLLTMLSLHYFEQAMWLQKLRRYIYISTTLEGDVTTLVKQLEEKPLDKNCIQFSQHSNWYEDWQQAVWRQQRRCHLQIGETKIDYLIEQMPSQCWYYMWRIGKSPGELLQWPVTLYRITAVAKKQQVQPLLTELYIAKPANAELKCANFKHQLILDRQSRRHRSMQELY